MSAPPAELRVLPVRGDVALADYFDALLSPPRAAARVMPAAPVEAPPENSARASEIPNAAWENWQPRRQLAAPTSPDAEAKYVDDEPAELDSAALGEVLSASLAGELMELVQGARAALAKRQDSRR